MLLIDEQRCVHRLAAAARCDACVRVCPQSAWSLDAQGLGFDAEACDGCGLCVAACATGALALPQPVRLVPPAAPALELALACAPALGRAPGQPADRAAAPPSSVLPCLHAVDEAMLLAAHRDGVRRLALYNSNCGRCPRGRGLGPGQLLTDRLSVVNRALQARGKAPLAWRLLAQALPIWLRPAPPPAQAAAPLAQRAAPLAQRAAPLAQRASEPVAARRAWLGLGRPRPPAASTVATTTVSTTTAAPAKAAQPPRLQATQALRALGQGPALWAVHLQADRCDACAACAQLCPTGAIALQAPSADQQTLALKAGECIGCALCVDACAPLALTRAPAAVIRDQVRRIELTEINCPACGKAYRYLLGGAAEAMAACPACRSQARRRADRIVQPPIIKL